jgi:hypothetical protein
MDEMGHGLRSWQRRHALIPNTPQV